MINWSTYVVRLRSKTSLPAMLFETVGVMVLVQIYDTIGSIHRFRLPNPVAAGVGTGEGMPAAASTAGARVDWLGCRSAGPLPNTTPHQPDNGPELGRHDSILRAV